ncbi:MAG: 6-phosphogluconolactonase [Bryobacterales bacterium]|nr:6-phosphogluconolactonase [Bryobacterales bacterium]
MLTNSFFEIADSVDDVAIPCAALIAERLRQALEQRPFATLAVSGGSTPAKLFPILAAAPLEWNRIHIFFVDERMVAPDDEASNFRLARTLLIEAAGIPAANVHRVQGEIDPAEAADLYEEEIARVFALDAAEDDIPAFDILHLGMGADAHTASLFPGDSAIDNLDGLCAAVYVEKLGMWRVTLLPAVLQSARCTVILAGGMDKAESLRQVLNEPYNPRRFPAQLVRHNLEVRWFLDRAAAARKS